MTVKELSLFFGKSEKTIRRLSHEIGIVFIHGVEKIFSKNEVFLLAQKLYKKMPEIIRDSIDLSFNKTNVQSTDKTNVQSQYITKQDLIDYSKTLVKDIFKELLPIIQNNKQIEYKQDYYSILGYMNIKKIDEARFSEMICYGKEASKISRELNKDIRKIPDERFGQINSYHIEVLQKVFEV